MLSEFFSQAIHPNPVGEEIFEIRFEWERLKKAYVPTYYTSRLSHYRWERNILHYRIGIQNYGVVISIEHDLVHSLMETAI